MKKSNQHHHPKKGDNITVAPIRRIEDIKSISKMLSDSPRNHLLFILGINNGLRVFEHHEYLALQEAYLKSLAGTIADFDQKNRPAGEANLLK